MSLQLFLLLLVLVLLLLVLTEARITLKFVILERSEGPLYLQLQLFLLFFLSFRRNLQLPLQTATPEYAKFRCETPRTLRTPRLQFPRTFQHPPKARPITAQRCKTRPTAQADKPAVADT